MKTPCKKFTIKTERNTPNSDEFELKFPELSQPELGRLQAEPSLGISIFELNRADFMYIIKKQIFTT